VSKLVKIGYVPFSKDFSMPGDRRRFAHFMNYVNYNFEIADFKKKYDLIVLTQAADLSKWLDYNNGKLILDIPDAYLQEELSLRRISRGIAKYLSGENELLFLDYKRLLSLIIRKSTCVITSTTADKILVESLGTPSWLIIDSAHEFKSIRKKNYRKGTTLNILWEGQATSLISFSQIRGVLQRLMKAQEVCLYLLTDKEYYMYMRKYFLRQTEKNFRDFIGCIDFKIIPWSVSAMNDLVNLCDVAIVPMHHSRIFQYKPPNRAIYFMKMGVPVLAGRNFSHRELGKTIGNDFYCDTDEIWLQKLLALAGSKSLRQATSLKNIEMIEKHFSEVLIMKKWAEALDFALGDNVFFKKLPN